MAKAADAFLTGRPYGIRLDFKHKGFALFNYNMNELGNHLPGRLETLPLEDFDSGGYSTVRGAYCPKGKHNGYLFLRREEQPVFEQPCGYEETESIQQIYLSAFTYSE